MATALAPHEATPQRCSQGSSPLRLLHGQVLPLFRLAARYARRPRRLRILPLVFAARTGHDLQAKTKPGTSWSTPFAATCRTTTCCGIYETRPQVCRDYSTKDCEYEDDWTYDFYLERPEQVAEYCEAMLQDEDDSIRSPKPPLLPIFMID